MIEQNLIEMLQLNGQELTNDTEDTYINEVIEIVEDIMEEVVIPFDVVEFSSDGSSDLITTCGYISTFQPLTTMKKVSLLFLLWILSFLIG